MPESWARCRPLSGLPSSRGSVPWGWPRRQPAGGLGKAVWAAGPGQAWAGSIFPGQPGPLGQEGNPSRGGEWDHPGASYGSGLGVTVLLGPTTGEPQLLLCARKGGSCWALSTRPHTAVLRSDSLGSNPCSSI